MLTIGANKVPSRVRAWKFCIHEIEMLTIGANKVPSRVRAWKFCIHQIEMLTIGANGRPLLVQVASYLEIPNPDVLNVKIPEAPTLLDEFQIADINIIELIVVLMTTPHEAAFNPETTITITLHYPYCYLPSAPPPCRTLLTDT